MPICMHICVCHIFTYMPICMCPLTNQRKRDLMKDHEKDDLNLLTETGDSIA